MMVYDHAIYEFDPVCGIYKVYVYVCMCIWVDILESY